MFIWVEKKISRYFLNIGEQLMEKIFEEGKEITSIKLAVDLDCWF